MARRICSSRGVGKVRFFDRDDFRFIKLGGSTLSEDFDVRATACINRALGFRGRAWQAEASARARLGSVARETRPAAGRPHRPRRAPIGLEPAKALEVFGRKAPVSEELRESGCIVAVEDAEREEVRDVCSDGAARDSGSSWDRRCIARVRPTLYLRAWSSSAMVGETKSDASSMSTA